MIRAKRIRARECEEENLLNTAVNKNKEEFCGDLKNENEYNIAHNYPFSFLFGWREKRFQ